MSKTASPQPIPYAAFLKSLLSWYAKDGRHDMPWRKTKDPYKIFVSEFMLQQTTVQTVRPYYERFLEAFPTVKALADAELNDVLARWSGLGYYARARNLWAAAKAVMEEHNGKIPSDPEALVKLPGVGFYTAGAVSSLAFNRPASVLDGNIIRVMMRVLAMEEDPKLKAVQAILRKATFDMTALAKKKSAGKLKNGPRDVVLALMDIGATLCSPRNPSCLACPANKFCLARKFGRQNEIPQKAVKAQKATVRRLFALIKNSGKWLMGQRPKEGLFGGLWEFPGTDADPGVNPILLLEEFFQLETGKMIRVKEARPSFEHVLTHKTMAIRPFLADLKENQPSSYKSSPHYEQFKWVAPREVQKLGVSAITKRILEDLKK